VSSHEITHLVHEYGLALVFVATALQALGFPVPGTTALAAAAFYSAAAHGLPIVGVLAAAAVGALAGTAGGFALGRWRGVAILNWIGTRLRQSPERMIAIRREFAAHGGAWVFVGRFISGVRNVVGLAAGATGMRLGRFLMISTAAATAWSLWNGLQVYYIGHTLVGASTWVQIVMVCVGIVWMLLSLNFLRRRAMRRVARSAADAG
jgi:membrane protein DedA with SNARE-associated domain